MDKYYGDLARAKLADAILDLQTAQNYINRAQLDDDGSTYKYVQTIINKARKATDMLGMFAADAEYEENR